MRAIAVGLRVRAIAVGLRVRAIAVGLRVRAVAVGLRVRAVAVGLRVRAIAFGLFAQRPRTSTARGTDPYEPVLGGAGTDYPVRPSTSMGSGSGGGGASGRPKTPGRRDEEGKADPGRPKTPKRGTPAPGLGVTSRGGGSGSGDAVDPPLPAGAAAALEKRLAAMEQLASRLLREISEVRTTQLAKLVCVFEGLGSSRALLVFCVPSCLWPCRFAVCLPTCPTAWRPRTTASFESTRRNE